MNGAGKKLWGYYPGPPAVWVPLQVDVDGKVVIDMSGISLDDLSDLNVPAPADGEALIWDDATSKWIAADIGPFACADLDACTLNNLHGVLVTPTANWFIYFNMATTRWESRLLVATDIPDLDAAKIISGILNPARVGPKIQDADADSYVWVEKTADEDKVHIVTKGDECGLFHDNGILDLVKQSSCKITSNAEQSIPNGSWTQMTFNADAYDIQDESDLANNRITVKKAGTYLVIVAATIYNMPDGSQLASGSYLNGEMIGQGTVCFSYVTSIMVVGTTVTYAAAGSHFTAKAYQDSGAAKDLSAYVTQNYLAIYKLG